MHRGWNGRALAAVVVLVLAGRAAAQAPAASGGSAAARAEPAAADPARAAEAELRSALFDLLSDRPASALARLNATAPWASDGADRDGWRRALARRALAVEAMARLGLDEQLERTAAEMLADPAARSLAPAIRARLAVQAYARGDDAAALRVASGDQPAAGDGVLPLVGALARMRAGMPQDAQSELAAARRAAGPAASYAAYVQAVARLRADSAAAPQVLDSLSALAARGDGAVADRAAVTAAQLAYQLGRYADAARSAGAVRGDAARSDALLVQGWALYKGGVATEAAAAFDELARRAPHDPVSGEAQVMAAQALLVAGATPDAARRLRPLGAAIDAEAAELERARASLVASVASDAVTRGAAAELFAPTDGLTLRLDGAGLFDAATLTALVAGRDAPAGAALRLSVAPDPRTAGPAGALATRLLRTPADPRRTMATRQELARRQQRLATADARAAAARLAVEREVAAQAATLGRAQAAQRALAADAQQLDALTRRLAAARAALARLPASGVRARRPARPGDSTRVEEERLRVQRDSVSRALARVEASAAAVRARRVQAVGDADRLAEAARRGTAVAQARAAAAAAETERVAAERALVELVARELDARVPVALATLRRDAEAAEFAAAGAAFLASSRGEAPRPAEVLRTRRASPAPATP